MQIWRRVICDLWSNKDSCKSFRLRFGSLGWSLCKFVGGGTQIYISKCLSCNHIRKSMKSKKHNLWFVNQSFFEEVTSKRAKGESQARGIWVLKNMVFGQPVAIRPFKEKETCWACIFIFISKTISVLRAFCIKEFNWRKVLPNRTLRHQVS